MKHLFKHVRVWWCIRQGIMPPWRQDKVAHMLGIGTFGCPVCGYDAVEEKNRTING